MPSSRFSTLNVFKLRPPDAAPPPPPKDPAYAPGPYNKSLFSRSTASLSPSLSPESVSGPATPATPYPPMPIPPFDFAKRSNPALSGPSPRVAAGSPAPSASGGSLRSVSRAGPDYLSSPSMDGSTDSSGSCPNTSPNPNPNPTLYQLNGASASAYTMSQTTPVSVKPKKSVFKLPSLAKRNKSRRDLSDAASVSESISREASVSENEGVAAKAEGDEGVSLPWNFQHNIHVDEAYIGLPPSWSAALSQAGFDEDEIAAIHARRRAAATAVLASNSKSSNPYMTERPASPHTVTVTPPTASTSSSTVLLEPAPRSTSLAQGHDTLKIHLPSMYSVATTTGGANTIGPPSLAPSPKAPSFSMKSLVSGIKNSLTSDAASVKDLAGSSRTGEVFDRYVFADGDGPEDNRNQGMGDETLIEPYPFDISSVSSRSRTMSQGQETPRTPSFPQIQVQHTRSDVGHVPFPSSASRAPSPLAHFTSLPIPAPPQGYAISSRPVSPSPSFSSAAAGPRPGPASSAPRTPPRRIYHVANPSSDSDNGVKYVEPPPAYVSPQKEDCVPKEKEGLGYPSSPNKPIPLTHPEENLGEPCGVSNHATEDQEASTRNNSGITSLTSLFVNNIPRTADEVLDITSYCSDDMHGGGAGMDPKQPGRVILPTPPLVIDKRLTKLATMPPRISFHQEGSLEDWSESLFSVIGGNEKRSSVLMSGDTTTIRKERRSTIRSISPPSITEGREGVSAMEPNSLCPEPTAPILPDVSFGANLTLGSHAEETINAVEEGGEQEQEVVEELAGTRPAPEDDAGEQSTSTDATTAVEEVKEVDESPAPPSAPHLPNVSPGPNISSLGKDLDPPMLTPLSPPDSPRGTSIDTLPPPPPPKPKYRPKPAPLALPPAAALAPPRTNVIPGISGRSPVNSLFGGKPQPLPVPISPSQIRAQLRPAPPKPLHPPPTLPLPPLKRIPSHINLPLPPPPPSQLPPVPSPQKTLRHDSIISNASSSDSRPSSSQTLLPSRVNPGDRDSGMSTITVTAATIATAKTEVVRTAVANIIDSDAVSLASKRDSIVCTADTESQSLEDDVPEVDGASPRMQVYGEVPDESLASEMSSVSLLRDGSQSKWPAPPPPPIELETDLTSRRLSRFRTTSLGRMTQLQAMGGSAMHSPMSSHFSHGSLDTTSCSTSESEPLTTPKGVNGVSPLATPKIKGGLAAEARLLSSTTDTFGGVDDESEDEGEACGPPSEMPSSGSQTWTPPMDHPLLEQLQPYITPRNPATCFTHLVEIAEGESGSVFAARVDPSFASETQGAQGGIERPLYPGTALVAIKRIPLPPVTSSLSLSDNLAVSNKLVSVLHEVALLRDLEHGHLLLLDAVYVGPNSEPDDEELVGLVDTALWIRMELMERSLADVIGLVAEGLVLQERLVGRFASDILNGLDYLRRQHIAHRDVRSDNLLVNAMGVVKLADFSNAIRVDHNAPTVSGVVGVIYWQPPEMRTGPYNALQVDVWSLGATVWELAETVPPFSKSASPTNQVPFSAQGACHIGTQWPPLTNPKLYSRAFHEFLKLCGRESGTRPGPGELLSTPFIRNACGRPVILQLLSQCHSIEEAMANRDASAGSS